MRSPTAKTLILILLTLVVAAGASAFLLYRRAHPPVVPADLIIMNGVLVPADGTDRTFEAIAVRGERIVQVGTSAEVLALRGPATNVVDAQGGTIMPGFNDTHFHMFLDLESGPIELRNTTGLLNIQTAIKEYADAHRGDAWVTGQGWLYSSFPGALPTRQQLDAVVPDRPAFLRSYDYHTAWANSKALALAGITKDTPDPRNGIIERDPVTHEPTGVLKENAQGLIMPLLPQVTLDQRLAVINTLIPQMHAMGITSIATADSNPAHFVAFTAARSKGLLKLRVSAAISPGPLFVRGSSRPIDDAMVDEFDAVRQQFPPDAFFAVRAIKLLADGVVEGHTAALLTPYSDTPQTLGMLAYDPGELTRVVTLLDKRGWPMMIHAIGDRAVRDVLDAYESAAKTNPAPAVPRRHRIEHMETMQPVDMARFGPLGVIAAFHPEGWAGHATKQAILSTWDRALGGDRVSRYGAWAPVTKGGGRVLIGSDYPAADFNTVERLYAVASPDAASSATSQLTMSQAIDTYTRTSAYAEFLEGQIGSLTPGYLADIVVLSQNIMATPLPDVRSVGVTLTVLNGNVVFKK